MKIKNNYLYLGILASTVLIGVCSISCSDNHDVSAKMSSSLQIQVTLRREQLANPTPERLTQMESMGMNTSTINIQKVYIYLKQQLTQMQINNIQTLGVIIFPNSWIPPVNNLPTGFILAEVPVDKLNALAAKDYIVSLDTAEIQLHPQSDIPKGS